MVVHNDHRHPKNAKLTTESVVNIVFFERSPLKNSPQMGHPALSVLWKLNRIDPTKSGSQPTLPAGVAGSHREQRRRNRGRNQKIGHPLQFPERQLV